MKLSLLLCVGWLVAGALFAYSLAAWSFSWNFLSFDPDFGRFTLAAIAGITASLTGFWFLARIVSLLVCIPLLAVGISVLPPEPSYNGAPRNILAFLARDFPSPLWFRGGILFTTALPLAFWLRWTSRPWPRTGRLNGDEATNPISD